MDEIKALKIIQDYVSHPLEDAVLIPYEEEFIVINVDAFNEETDWLPGADIYSIGWRAAIASLSDVVVKGAKPYGTIVSLKIPPHFQENSLKELYNGLKDASRSVGAEILGGDTDIIDDSLRIEVTSIGFGKNIIRRSTAKPQEIIYVSGKFGLTSLIYYSLFFSNSIPCEYILDIFPQVIRPKLIDLSKWLRAVPFITASIDSSDGLAASLHQLAIASNVRIRLHRIPIDEYALKCFSKMNIDPIELVLYYGGEEFIFIFTVPPYYASRVEQILGNYAIRVGVIEEGQGVFLEKWGKIENRGWISGRGW